jgi:hypothetical protein
MKYDEVKILDAEETEDGRLRVPFEVPGHHFNQSYPKRLSHCFVEVDKFLEVVDDQGTRRFEKILKDIYLADNSEDTSRDSSSSDIEEVRAEIEGGKKL